MSKMTIDVKLTKDHAGVKLSKGGVKYLSLNGLVEDTQDGGRWYDGVVFGALADNAAPELKKGTEMRLEGQLTVSEYTKRDGSVGTNNKFTISKITLEGGRTLDKFAAGPAAVNSQADSRESAPF